MDQIMRSSNSDTDNHEASEDQQKPAKRKLIVSIPLDIVESEPNASTDDIKSEQAAYRI
mgnify:FL=1